MSIEITISIAPKEIKKLSDLIVQSLDKCHSCYKKNAIKEIQIALKEQTPSLKNRLLAALSILN